jgi:mono/diheme cytochrome c family protein
MRFRILLTVLFCIWEAPLLNAADAQAGKTLYDANCKGCHGAKGEGNPTIGTMLGVTFRHLGSKQVQAKTDEELRENAAKGTGKFQKRPTTLTDSQLQDIVAFVRTLALP